MKNFALTALGAVAFSVAGAIAANAGTVDISLTESGSDVLLSYSGDIDLTGLVRQSVDSGPPFPVVAIGAAEGGIAVTAAIQSFDLWELGAGDTGMPAFGPGVSGFAIIGSEAFGFGDAFSISSFGLATPEGFTSGPISGSFTISSVDFSVLGAVDGTYSSSVGDNVFNLTVGAGAASTVPLPAAAWLLVAGLGGLAATRRRHA